MSLTGAEAGVDEVIPVLEEGAIEISIDQRRKEISSKRRRGGGECVRVDWMRKLLAPKVSCYPTMLGLRAHP